MLYPIELHPRFYSANTTVGGDGLFGGRVWIIKLLDTAVKTPSDGIRFVGDEIRCLARPVMRIIAESENFSLVVRRKRTSHSAPLPFDPPQILHLKQPFLEEGPLRGRESTQLVTGCDDAVTGDN